MRIARFRAGDDVAFGVVEGDQVAALASHPFGPLTFTGDRYPLESVRLLAPIIPSKVVAIGKNYADHAKEMGDQPPPETPMIFMKPSTSIPTTALSATAGCSISADSISIGETHRPETLIMSSERPSYQ